MQRRLTRKGERERRAYDLDAIRWGVIVGRLTGADGCERVIIAGAETTIRNRLGHVVIAWSDPDFVVSWSRFCWVAWARPRPLRGARR